MNTLDVSRWLWDFYFSGTLLLGGALLACLFARQPARRVALVWATAVGLLALACLTTLPNWSRWHLSAPAPPAPAWTADLQPVIGQAIQSTVELPAVPAPELLPGMVPAATQFRVIDWGVIALYALAAGSAVVVTWLALGAWQVRRLRASAKPAPPEILRLFEQLTHTPGKNFQLGVLDNLPVAVAVGLRKPAILLPQTLVTQANREQLRSVLAHELAHIAHRDLWLLALLRGLMLLLWPHPLFWFLRRRVRLDQEILADAAAAELTSRGEYAEQLVTLARTATQVRVPRLASSVGLWETRAQLKERITLLLDEKLTILRSCSRKWRVGTFMALVGVALGLSLVTLTPAEVEVEASVTTPDRDDRLRATDIRDFGRLNPDLLTPQGLINTKSHSAIDFDTSETVVLRRNDLLRATDPRDYRLKPDLLRAQGTFDTNHSSAITFGTSPKPSAGFDLSTPFVVQRGPSIRFVESPVKSEIIALETKTATLTGRVVTQEANEEPKPSANVEILLQRQVSPDTTEEVILPLLNNITDAKGIYRFESLPDGKYAVIANRRGWLTKEVKYVEVNAGQVTSAPDVVMTRGGRVRIQLVDDISGKPLHFNEPTKGSLNIPSRGPRPISRTIRFLSTLSDTVEFSEEGIAEIQVPAGKFAFSVSIPGKDSSPGWMAVDFMRIRDIFETNKLPTYEVAEGEVLQISVRMTRESPQEQSVVVPTPSKLVPTELRDKNAYENGIFVPEPSVAPVR